uniref:3CxxC-type domain-containing protein n=1 Tax=Cyanistes caeruleus TaxID=156563 RepID=A0A8C0ZEP1_CYACU
MLSEGAGSPPGAWGLEGQAGVLCLPASLSQDQVHCPWHWSRALLEEVELAPYTCGDHHKAHQVNKEPKPMWGNTCLVTTSSPASSGTMTTWQGIFAVKIEEMHITDPWTLVEDDFLQVQDCRPGWKEFVQNRALGRFECSQCFHKWSSAKVHILFHMCHSQGWGTVWMRIFRQKCRRCPNSRLEDPEFSLETVETILHNLAIKILQYFYNKPVQPSDLLEVVVDTLVTGPHDRAHCEACQLGNSPSSPLLYSEPPVHTWASQPWLHFWGPFQDTPFRHAVVPITSFLANCLQNSAFCGFWHFWGSEQALLAWPGPRLSWEQRAHPRG